MAPLSVYTSFYASLFKSMVSLLFARLYKPPKVSQRDLTGQNAIVTGANSGLGYCIAKGLAQQGATVHLACRSLARGGAAISSITKELGEESRNRLHCWQLDVSDLNSVRSFCEKWKNEGKKIDMLVHNAGIAGVPQGASETTKDGLDTMHTTNFLSSFLITHLLEPQLSCKARVVFTSSTGHYSDPNILRTSTPASHPPTQSLAQNLGFKSSAPAYAHSKAHQVLFAHVLQQHFYSLPSPDNRRTAHSFTPGFAQSSIFSKYHVDWKMWVSNPLFVFLKASEKWIAVATEDGARTGVWLASGVCDDGVGVEGGGYWEWAERRVSLVDLTRGVMGEAEFRRKAGEVWEGWGRDCGVEG